jgi:predicted DNA-binding antitoxin AbrB/MazE fold protein
MNLTIDAVFENGVLRPLQPLPLADQQRVRVTVEPAPRFVPATYGLLGGKVDAQTVERIALDPQFSVLEAP